MDIISLILGFSIGVIVVAIAFEIGWKKRYDSTPASKPTKSWSIDEISNPRIMAEYLNDVELPKNSKVLVNKYKTKATFAGMDVRENKGIRGNYILGDDRALILAGPIKKDEVAFWTVEKEIVDKLNQEFNQMWLKGTAMENKEIEKQIKEKTT